MTVATTTVRRYSQARKPRSRRQRDREARAASARTETMAIASAVNCAACARRRRACVADWAAAICACIVSARASARSAHARAPRTWDPAKSPRSASPLASAPCVPSMNRGPDRPIRAASRSKPATPDRKTQTVAALFRRSADSRRSSSAAPQAATDNHTREERSNG